MPAIESTMIELGTKAPYFDLPIANPEVDSLGTDTRSLSDYNQSDILVVVFTCNHCPYAVHVEDALNAVAHDFRNHGVQVVAINANDAETYPADSMDNMAIRARSKGFTFPYLYDESQEVARAYGAVCTPDTFVFDHSRALCYHGQIDSTRPGGDPADASDLRRVLNTLVAGGQPKAHQQPSVGCSIKWKR